MPLAFWSPTSQVTVQWRATSSAVRPIQGKSFSSLISNNTDINTDMKATAQLNLQPQLKDNGQAITPF